MSEPDWITREDCRRFHEVQIARYGGLPGVRDEGLLDSALNRPRQLFTFGNPTLHELAAAYAFGIAKNHPFLDGNKRCALMGAIYFLETNGFRFKATVEDAIRQTVALAASEVSEAEFANWLEMNSEMQPS